MTKETLQQEFAKVFGDSEGTRVFFAPGRVNLIGEHTDYNGGHVFPCALTFGTYACVRKRDDDKLRFYSMNFNSVGVIETDLSDMRPKEDHQWVAYPKGVIWALNGKGYKIDKGLDMLIYGDIPNGSGLSSSASLEVLTGYVCKNLFGLDISNVDIALNGQYSENNYNGCNCGIMDQFASAMGKEGHAIFLDTNTLEYEYAPLALDGYKIVITNSNVKHSLVNSEYNTRRKECEAALKDLQTVIDCKTLGDLNAEQLEANISVIKDDNSKKRAKHAVCENIRTVKALQSLKDNNVEDFGDLMNASHLSLQLDYEVSCPEVDELVHAAWDIPGVVGSRITGGGFGGCTVSIVKDGVVDRFKEEVAKVYKEKCGIDCDFYVVEAGEGPHEL